MVMVLSISYLSFSTSFYDKERRSVGESIGKDVEP